MKLVESSTASAPDFAEKTSSSQPWLNRPPVRLLLLLAALGAALAIRESGLGPSLGGRLQTFVTIFLSIFIEAVPFLLAGAVVSGFIEVFVNKEVLYRFVPRHPMLAALAGGSLGLVFPVCECGVVPVTRRLYQKGLPMSMGIAFLLAAPVVNPVVVASTYAAFGWGPMLWGRFGLSFFIASLIGMIFYFARPQDVLLPDSQAQPDPHQHGPDCHHPPAPSGSAFSGRVWQSLAIAGDDFFDMGRYLVAGSMLAAAMQTVVPQPVLLSLGSGMVSSVLAMMGLAFVLSVCSTVDAFLALAFTSTFTPPSILAFLTFGPMVDIKSALMFLGVFKKRTVFYLILLPLIFTLLITVFLNLNVRW